MAPERTGPGEGVAGAIMRPRIGGSPTAVAEPGAPGEKLSLIHI